MCCAAGVARKLWTAGGAGGCCRATEPGGLVVAGEVGGF